MQYFKNLLPRTLETDQALSTVVKKADQFKKFAMQSTQIVTSLNKVYDVYLQQLPKILGMLLGIQKGQQEMFYVTLKEIYADVYKEYQSFTLDYLQTPSNEISNNNNLKYMNFSGCLLTFQQQLKNYIHSQNAMIELAKKYSKNQKLLSSSIQAYKQSFTQAKLIYNMDQKLKRYTVCEQYYKAISQDNSSLIQLKDKLNEKKKILFKTFESLSKQMGTHENEVDIKTLKFLSKFNSTFCESIKKRIKLIQNKKSVLEKSTFAGFFANFSLEDNEKQPKDDASRRKAGINLKKRDSLIGMQIQNLKRAAAKIQIFVQKKKTQHLKIYQFHLQFFKNTQKKCGTALKQAFIAFEKNKKKIKQQFLRPCYEQFKNTLTIIKINFEVFSEVQKKILMRINNVSESIEQFKNIIKNLIVQINSIVLKAYEQNKDKDRIEFDLYKQKTKIMSAYIYSANQKLNTNLSNIREALKDILHIYESGIIQTSEKCNQIGLKSKQNLFANIDKQKELFSEKLKSTPFGQLLGVQVNNNIVFQEETERISDFKKLKKPVEIDVVSPQSKEVSEKQQQQIEEDDQTEEQSKIKSKHLQFIRGKANFVEGQDLLKTYSCALADKIILQGRIFITTHRICFYSKFNPSNVFFGQTFIQIPKKDIITLQKRKNGIFFDNSISLTTVKGEVFLTSFFKRNEAFAIMSSTIGLNQQNNAYQEDGAFESDTSSVIDKENDSLQKKFSQIDEIKNSQQIESDLQQEQVLKRQEAIQKFLSQTSYNFKQISKAEFVYKNLNALKLLKMLHFDGQVVMNGKKYQSFNEYFKKALMLHRDVETQPFNPSIYQHLESQNIKITFPLKTMRTRLSTVPTPPSNIPFMPKFAKTSETQSFYVVSKHKWILDVELQNSGAPYTDCFKVYYRTKCNSVPGKVTIQTGIYVNFFKSCMVKGIIISKTQEESTTLMKKEFDNFKKYLSKKQKQQNAKLRKVGSPNKENSEDLLRQIEQLSPLKSQNNEDKQKQENQQIEQLKQKHEKRVKQLENKIKTQNKIILVLILICLLSLVGNFI